MKNKIKQMRAKILVRKERYKSEETVSDMWKLKHGCSERMMIQKIMKGRGRKNNMNATTSRKELVTR